jgi:hypothetical protein
MMEITAQEIRDLVQRIRKHAGEERELVRVFFADMVASGPLWLVPSLLGFVASEAAVAELQFGLRTAGTIPIDDLPY